ncbi:serine/threonine protein kinase [Fonticula alba]|uniref:Serine/threonine protein kinase n=1 Tax=Fonticula alba TaxID=691883 RepID=A0A058Z0Q4_FONAL|nr:serine/threonine protein kinase [Fonticula alba]KCV67468.1 serine/threonine protein kinase [Fonticula alba]|eukprot:XP_009498144.1 serine/threonine protein kinase [Fonticula alba]
MSVSAGSQVTVSFSSPQWPYYQASQVISLTYNVRSAHPFLLHDRAFWLPRIMELWPQGLQVDASREPGLAEGINIGENILVLQEDPLGREFQVTSEWYDSLLVSTISGPAGSRTMVQSWNGLEHCVRSQTHGACVWIQTYPTPGGANIHMGRVGRTAGGSTSSEQEPPMVGIISDGRIGRRPLATTPVAGALWLEADNHLGLDTVLVLHEAPSELEDDICWLGWQPRLVKDEAQAAHVPEPERLLADPLPCGQLLGLPAVGATGRPPVLLAARRPAADGPVLYILRNRARPGDNRPRFEAPVALLTTGQLGHPAGKRLDHVQVIVDRHGLTPTRAVLFLADGNWVFRVVLEQDTTYDGAGHSHHIQVMVEPLIPRHTAAVFGPEPKMMLALDIDGDGVSELAILKPEDRTLVIFRQASEDNGCGCGRAGQCTIPDEWHAIPCESTDARCVPWPTGMRVADLCTCGAGHHSDPTGEELCVQCNSTVSGVFPPTFGVDCVACEVDGCYLCTASGRCLRCRPGLVLTPDGQCATACPDPDAPVEDGQCRSPTPADVWVSAAEVQAHASWAGARVVDVSNLRPVTHPAMLPGSRAIASTFPSLHVLAPGDPQGRDSVWLLPAASLLADGRASPFGRLHLRNAVHWLRDTCFHLAPGVVTNNLSATASMAADTTAGPMPPPRREGRFPGWPGRPAGGAPWRRPSGAGGDRAASTWARGGEAPHGEEADLRAGAHGAAPASSRPRHPRPEAMSGLAAGWGAFASPPGEGPTAAGVTPVQSRVDHSRADIVARDIIVSQELPIRRPWFAALAEPFPAADPQPGASATGQQAHPEGMYIQQKIGYFYTVFEMVAGVEVAEDEGRICSADGVLLPAVTRLTRHGSLEGTQVFGGENCFSQDVWLPFPASELSMPPGTQDWWLSQDAYLLLRQPTTGAAQPSLVFIWPANDWIPARPECHLRMMEIPLIPGSWRLPIVAIHESLMALETEYFFMRVPSIREFHPTASASGPGVVYFENPLIAEHKLLVALAPEEPAIMADLQLVTMLPSNSHWYMVFVRTDGQADSIMAMPVDCLVENHANWQEAPRTYGTPGRSWPTARPTYGCEALLLETRPLEGDGPHGRPLARARDMNSDGLDDLVLHWPTSGRVVVYMTQSTLPLSFRQTVVLPGRVTTESMAPLATEYPVLLDPTLFMVDVDGDRFLDIVILEHAAAAATTTTSAMMMADQGAGLSSLPPAAPPLTLRVFGRSDQTNGWCPAGVDFDPLTGECQCPGQLRHMTPLSDECECIEHALPVAPGAADCTCPATMVPGVGRCICEAGLLPVADEATGKAIAPARCEACHASCAACSATRPGLCAACPLGQLLLAGVCVPSCGSGFFVGPDGRQCITCAATCAACLGPASSQCTACAGNRYLPGGVPGTCRACDAACNKCLGPTASQCVACAAGWLRAPSGECVRTCPEGTGLSAPGSGVCAACADPGCAMCVTAQAGAICQACRDGLQIDPSGKRCIQCHASCDTCSDDGPAGCLTCAPGLLMHESACVAACPAGTFASGALCERCSSRCATCSGPLSSECLSCPDGWLQQADGACLPGPCPTCVCNVADCEACSPTDPDECLMCGPGLLLSPDGTCTSACPSGMYAPPSGDKCQACDVSCAECTSGQQSACTACPGTHVLHHGKCQEACPAMWFSQEGGVCTPCHGSCLSCGGSGEDQCQVCLRSHIFHQNHCLKNCPPSSTPLAGRCVECDMSCVECVGPTPGQCTACSPARPQLWEGSCLEECPLGTFSEAGVCLPCGPYCLSCVGAASHQCTQCAGDLLLHPTHGCVSACGTGLLPEGNRCVPCDAGCRHCQDTPGHCVQCPAGTFLGTTPGTCVAACGDREFVDMSLPTTARCVGCHGDCASCEGGPRAEHCTTCVPGLTLRVGTGCAADCPAGFFEAEGPWPGTRQCARCAAECTACTGPDAPACTRCIEDRLLLVGSGVCLPVEQAACPSGWHMDAAGRRCLRCSDGCLSCDGAAEDCEQCTPGMHSIRLLDRKPTDGAPVGTGPRTCVVLCPDGWFVQAAGSASHCASCDGVCATCDGPGPDGCLLRDCNQPGACPKTGARSLLLTVVLPVALLLLLLLIALLVFFLLWRRRRAAAAAAAKQEAIPMQYIGNPEDMTIMNTVIELSLPGHLLLTPEVDYRVERQGKPLGQGAQAVVLSCALLRDDLVAAAGGSAGAVKMVPPDSAFRKQFEPLLDQEIAILSLLLADGGSPFVCRLVGYSTAAPGPALIMPHYPGVLSGLLATGALSPAQALGLAADIAAGVAFIHAHGVVHKDLKPENVFVRPDPADPARLQPVIGDFGVALVLNRFSVIPTLGDVAAGSLPYAPPETLARLYGLPFALAPPEGSVVSLLKVDIYSLGVLLFSLVSRVQPWADTAPEEIPAAVLAGRRPHSEVQPDHAPWLGDYRWVYQEAWAADPRERPSAADMATRLSDLAAGWTGPR